MDYSLTASISENLSNEQWPVRMMALYLLSCRDSDNFGAVLDWNARYDPYPLNRQMATALGGHSSAEAQEEKPAELPETAASK